MRAAIRQPSGGWRRAAEALAALVSAHPSTETRAMLPETSISAVAPALRLSVAPVFLLSALGTLLSFLREELLSVRSTVLEPF